MVYKPHTLVAFGGSNTEVAFGDEIWECTVRGISPGGTGLPLGDPNGYMGEIHAALGTWFNNSGSGMAGNCDLRWLKVNNIGADGKYTDNDTNVYDYPTPVAGGATQVVPSYLSVAMSWTTNRKRPPGAFGRIYPPNYTYAMQGAAINTANQNAVRTAAIALLNVLRNCGGDLGFVPVIASRVNASNTEITGVRVGNIYDHIERRRNAVAETYVSAGWDSSCN